MTAPITPTFALTDHHGNPVTHHSYRGRWQLVFFGFTHCKAVCPRALQRLSATLDDLHDIAAQITPLYITVDPDRDTPDVMKNFLHTYLHFTGLTGTTTDIDHARTAFRVYARRKDDPHDPDGYAMPHTALTYLLSPQGHYVEHYPDTMPQEELTTRLRAHLTT